MLMPGKDEIARVLAQAHREIEATITRIVRIVGPNEADGREPIKLLEVNTAATASGIGGRRVGFAVEAVRQPLQGPVGHEPPQATVRQPSLLGEAVGEGIG
jgi:hypothetical protein